MPDRIALSIADSALELKDRLRMSLEMASSYLSALVSVHSTFSMYLQQYIRRQLKLIKPILYIFLLKQAN